MQFAKWVPNSDGFGHTAPVKCNPDQSNTQVSRPSGIGMRFGRECKSTGSNTPPNPSIEGTHKRLRLLRSPHVKR